jgi:hypothetical protein
MNIERLDSMVLLNEVPWLAAGSLTVTGGVHFMPGNIEVNPRGKRTT